MKDIELTLSKAFIKPIEPSSLVNKIENIIKDENPFHEMPIEYLNLFRKPWYAKKEVLGATGLTIALTGIATKHIIQWHKKKNQKPKFRLAFVRG